MGSFLSCYKDGEDRCQHCNKKAQALFNNECEPCMRRRVYASSTAARNPSAPVVNIRVVNRAHNRKPPLARRPPKPRPLFGEYRCSCGRIWNSRKSWRGHYLTCKSCGTNVYPHAQRELRASDMSGDRENPKLDHPKELCQMCIELGYYCGKME